MALDPKAFSSYQEYNNAFREQPDPNYDEMLSLYEWTLATQGAGPAQDVYESGGMVYPDNPPDPWPDRVERPASPPPPPPSTPKPNPPPEPPPPSPTPSPSPTSPSPSGGTVAAAMQGPVLDPRFTQPWGRTFDTGQFQWPTFTPPPAFTYPEFKPPPAFEYPEYQAPAPFNYPEFEAPAPFSYADFQAPPPFKAPTAESILSDPSYQFREGRLRGAIENSAAARGVLNSGGTLDDILSGVGSFASQEYGNIWDREFARANQGFNQALSGYQANRGNAADIWKTNYDTSLGAYATNRGNAADIYNTNLNAGFDAYKANRAGAENAYTTNYGVNLGSYNVNRGNAADIYNANYQAAIDARDYERSRADTMNQRAWQAYLDEQNAFVRDRDAEFEKLYRLTQLGAGVI